jgi:trehalose synthase
MAQYRITEIDDYEALVGAEVVQRIRDKADKLKGLRVANFNSTYYGGGVAEIISSLTLLMNGLGLRTEWRVIQGTPDFFSITKKMHNALQGGEIDLSRIKKEIFEQVIYENSVRNFLDHDFIIVHDPQPLPLIEHYEKKCPWLWRCHLDLSRPRQGNVEVSATVDRQLRRCDSELPGVRSGDEAATTSDDAGD